MGAGYKRVELQAISQSKIDDAVLLFENKRFSNAYYLAGFSVEIGLKACVAAQITAETVPDKALLNGFLVHEFKKLVGLAGLTSALKQQQDNDPDFAANWAIALEWVPDARYQSKDVTSTQFIIHAIKAQKSGVLEWIKAYW